MIDTLTDEKRKARKQHRCGWCPDPIEPGIEYRYVVVANSGDISTWKEHVRCGLRVAAYARYWHIDDEYDYAGIEWRAVLEWEQELRSEVPS